MTIEDIKSKARNYVYIEDDLIRYYYMKTRRKRGSTNSLSGSKYVKNIPCANCGKEDNWVFVNGLEGKTRSKYSCCSRKCVGVMQQSADGNTIINGKGHILEVCRTHPNAYKPKGYVPQHRLVIEKDIGRYLIPKKEVVHHIDMDKTNNDISNLWLCNERQHAKAHASFYKLCKILMKRSMQVAFDTEIGEYYLKEKK